MSLYPVSRYFGEDFSQMVTDVRVVAEVYHVDSLPTDANATAADEVYGAAFKILEVEASGYQHVTKHHFYNFLSGYGK